MSDDFPKGPEKRNYQRVELELPVRLEVAGQEIQTTTENISCGGMFLPTPIQAEDSFVEDQVITAFISIPDQNKVIKMAGSITRVHKKYNADTVGLAIQFSGLYDDNRLEIDRFLKWKMLN